MKIFRSWTLTWWQVAVCKLTLIALGIILGVYFQAFFLQWIVLVTLVFTLGAVYLIGVWWRQGGAD
jgi:hypothetical protein